MKHRGVLSLALGLVLGAGSMELLHAQQQAGGIKRTMLQKGDLIDIPGREVIMGTAEIPPGGSAGRHTHFGTEVGYVLEGTAVFEVEGYPPRELKPGDSYFVEPGKVHDAKVTSSGPAKVLAIYIVEKGKPLATPAP